MTRGVRLYLVGSLVLASLAGCGRGFFQAEREPWRAEAEVACLKSGAVKEGPERVRIEPISGPGACGADYPLKVAAFGEDSAAFGFADNLRPPAAIGNQPRWPVARPQGTPQNYPNARTYPNGHSNGAPRQPNYAAPSNAPISLAPPGIVQQEDDIDLPAQGAPGMHQPRAPYANAPAYPSHPPRAGAPYSERQDFQRQDLPRLGPSRGDAVDAVGPVSVKPAATLACPIVSTLDRWFAESVQPAAQRWFGTRVVEIKQISAYSCRGMNGNPHAHISEHAFGNALDISAFTLADGRRVTVKEGWRGLPEEQGFLRDVQGGACQLFNTVLAPGSNPQHADHFHFDLMRRSSGRIICQPAAVSGDQIAARAGRRNPYPRESWITGSLGGKRATHRHKAKVNEEDEFADD
ncbi:extensin family protein [Bradyrhizobium sp.]|uniref:extensin family protein n=1 Tax=Bradyrhizobium sp. TaxID=376 RepID=UPI0040383066